MKILLVDGFNLLRRIYEARREPDLDAVVLASSRSLARGIDEHRPTHAVVVLELHDRTWRHLLYPEYKAGRSPPPTLLTDHLPDFEASFLQYGVRSFSLPSYEADDVIATMAVAVAAANGQSVILSSDSSYLQLLGAGVEIVNHFDHSRASQERIDEKYGVEVEQLIDYWSLAGDQSNNIKGVPGVGAKTAARLLLEHGSVDAILAGAGEDGPATRVRDHRQLVLRCRQLVTLKTDVELGANLRDFRLDARVPTAPDIG